MKKVAKAELWGNLSVLFFGISGSLVFNQFAPKELHGILPLWVLGLFVGLTIVCGLNSWRHSGEQDVRQILKKNQRRFC